MKVKLEWSVTVNSSVKVFDVVEFAGECLRGLIASEMVPDDAHVSSANEGFGGQAYVTIRWQTETEMETSDNYKVS